ncbi:MAG TPA: DUF86 domain-containing protein [Chitinivibrionales bacterium]|nr:DUF86 domain-containing protein [Chitinivibrionales bacterium]
MPKREARLLLDDMIAAIEKINRYIAGLKMGEFLKDEKTCDAVTRNLEIIGEAARQCPEAFKTKHSEIPWAQITGLRHRIVHDYTGVDLELVWQIINSDMKELLNNLRSL